MCNETRLWLITHGSTDRILRSRIIIMKLTATQRVRQFYGTSMELGRLLAWPLATVFGTHPEPEESILYPHILLI
jgi:hypothetical protein